MTRWSMRLRRAAGVLLAVHLLQIVLLAANSICESPALTALAPAAADVAAAPDAASHAAHAHHVVSGDAQTTGAPVADSTDGSTQAPHHAPTPGATCPMAMACSVTAVVAQVPEVASTIVDVPTIRVWHVVATPRTVHGAPEPPPPRA
ncbi:hypothetical protein [Gemmatimonas sp.]